MKNQSKAMKDKNVRGEVKKHNHRILYFLLFFFVVISSLPLQATENVVENVYFTVSFNKSKKTVDLFAHQSLLRVEGLSPRVHLGSETLTGASERFKVKTSIERLKTPQGNHHTMKISYLDTKGLVDMIYLISLEEHSQAIIFELICRNPSEVPLNILSSEPFFVSVKDGGKLIFHKAVSCLTNGAMYYDAGMIHQFGNLFIRPVPYGDAKGGQCNSPVFDTASQTVQSWWNACLFSGQTTEALSLGYLLNENSLGRLRIFQESPGVFSVAAESVYSSGCWLAPGEEISSDKFSLLPSDSPYNALELYADIMARDLPPNHGKALNGWCNWFYTHGNFSETEILENAKFIAKVLKGYGVDYVQIDEGYQVAHGNWNGNELFPHGLKYFADSIKMMGLQPGIWISPFVVSEHTTIFKEHPDWFLQNADGRLKRIGPWPGEDTDWFRNENPKRYGLDITHPEAEKWFRELIDTIANQWGFGMIKIDFVAWTVFSAHHFYDSTATPAAVYRKALQIIRNTGGEKCHVLDCGPGNVTAGLINSMRIEYDQNYGFRNDAWKQYFMGSSCSAGAMGKRYFYHNKTWINDADHVCLDLLSVQQSQAAASLIALSGGNMISGDRLTTLDPVRLEILKKCFPTTGTTARPVDITESDPQTSFAVQFEKPYRNWTVAGFFNPDLEVPVVKKYKLDRLWLEPEKSYLCYDFWQEQYLGELSDSLILRLDPGSVRLLSIQEKSDIPLVLSTTRHIMQGAVELESLQFDSLSAQFKGISLGPENSSHDVIVWIPDKYYWMPSGHPMYEDSESYTIKSVDTNVLRIRLDFRNTSRIQWAIKLTPASQTH